MGTKDGFAAALLAWYDAEARRLPWRRPPGTGGANPYHVLVSEVMLQQTTVAVVEKRFAAFLDQFPDLFALAAAPEARVLAAWAGLGYYRRARALHACARVLVDEHGGGFPRDERALRALPGIGEYTAAAIAAIAFDQPAVVVDGNIERVIARVFAIETPIPSGRREVRHAAASLTPPMRAGDHAQAMMDLGARICRPRQADCLLCPVRSFCDAQGSDDPLRLPVKAPRKDKVPVTGRVFVVLDHAGQVLCEDRPAEGLFGGMLGLPGGGWDGRPMPELAGEAIHCGGVSHILTHRRLDIDVYRLDLPQTDAPGRWLPIEDARSAMPTLFRKALERGLSSDGS